MKAVEVIHLAIWYLGCQPLFCKYRIKGNLPHQIQTDWAKMCQWLSCGASNKMVHNLTFDHILHLKSIVVLLHFYLKRKLFPYSISMALCDSSPQDVSSFQKKKKLNNVGNFFFFMKKKRKVISQNIFYPQKTVTQFQNRVMVIIFIFG